MHAPDAHLRRAPVCLALDEAGPTQVGTVLALQVERWHVLFAQAQFKVIGGDVA